MTLDMWAERIPLKASQSRRNIVLAAVSSLLYIVVFGMVTAYSAPASVDMTRPGSRFVDVTDDQIAWIASLPSLASVFGNVASGYLSQKLGRKAVLMYVSASYTFSWLVIAYAPDLGFVYTGRLVSGFCSGVCAVAVPAYIVEISAVEIRGLLTSWFQVAFALGVFLVMALGIFLRWSWLAVSAAVLVVAGAFLTCFVPESPAWLIRATRNIEAFQALRFLRSDYHSAAREFQDIVDYIAEEPKAGLTLKELFQPQLYKPMGIAVALMLFQQFSGINALMSYAVELFQTSKICMNPSVAATIVALVQVLATAVSSLLMDKAGRRTLYVASGVCMTLSLSACGVYSFFFETDPTDLARWNWVPLVGFVTYIAAFSLGFGPVPFVVTPEMVPTHSRSFLLAVACVSSSFFSFVVTKTFDNLRSAVGLSGTYWIYAAFALVGFSYYWAYIPETKGRTIKEIHRNFSVPNGNEM